MRYSSIASYQISSGQAGRTGPIALLMAEDEAELAASLQHLLRAGFERVVLLAPPEILCPAAEEQLIDRIDYDVFRPDALVEAVNALMGFLAGRWIYYGYNAEFLFWPFCESRSIRDLVTFQAEERRQAIISYVIDLYAPDLKKHSDAVSLSEAHLDRIGYYALERKDPEKHWTPRERQKDFFGGLRLRFEEHVPWDRRKIDRIALFRARADLRLRPDFTLSDEEMNTYACPWHHNITTAICSFRTAKALRSNPGSRSEIAGFHWYGSERFRWHSQQLMDLGLMEPGQWF